MNDNKQLRDEAVDYGYFVVAGLVLGLLIVACVVGHHIVSHGM